MKSNKRTIPAMLRWLVCGATLLNAAPQASAEGQGYAIQPGDVLRVMVWKEEDLQQEILVRPDGGITFPLAGSIEAAGHTVEEVRTDLVAKIKEFIPEPVVTAAVTNLEGNRIYVIGQVTKPGSYPMNPRLNVLQALTVAGGMTPFANLDGIIVLRSGAGGKQRVLPFRYGDVSKGRNLEQNAPLEAGDVVIVP